jgi:hypothetical protein
LNSQIPDGFQSADALLVLATALATLLEGGSLIESLSPPELSEKDNDLLPAAYAGRLPDAVRAPPSWMRAQE